MIPLMMLVARDMPQIKAHATSLVAVMFTGIAGGLAYLQHGSVDWRAALSLSLGAIITAHLGVRFAHSLPERRLKQAFGAFMLVVSVLVVVKAYLHGDARQMAFWPRAAILIATGLGTGFLSGMMGVGGGSFMIPGMVLLAGMDQRVAQGTSLMAMIPASFVGALTHYRLGNVETSLAASLIPGALIGAYLGGRSAGLLPDIYLRILFAVVLVWMGVKYLRARPA